MINIFLGIIITFFTAALVLQIIGTLKNIRLMTLITKPFLLTMTTAFFILIIKDYLPDSRFLLIYGTVALALAFSGNILFIFNRTGTKIAGAATFLLSTISALFVTFPSFKLFTPPLPVSVIYFIIYGSIITVLYIFLIKEKSVLPSILYFVFFAIKSVYLYSVLITCQGERKVYSFIMLLSACLLLSSGFFMTKKEADNKPLFAFLSITLCTLSYASLSASLILMQAF